MVIDKKKEVLDLWKQDLLDSQKHISLNFMKLMLFLVGVLGFLYTIGVSAGNLIYWGVVIFMLFIFSILSAQRYYDDMYHKLIQAVKKDKILEYSYDDQDGFIQVLYYKYKYFNK